MTRERHESRDEWLKARNKPMFGIGASEAALICGIRGAYGNLDELYSVKRGISKPRSFTNDRIEGGIMAEPLIRDLFAVENRDRYKVTYRGYDILRSDEHPFMFCTLDGELEDLDTHEMGVLEIKKIEVTHRSDLEKWNGGIPEYYLVQQIHQMEVTGWDFNLLVAVLSITEWDFPDGSPVPRTPYKRTEYRYSYIRRDDADYRANADFVIRKELEFWNNLEKGIRPSTRIF